MATILNFSDLKKGDRLFAVHIGGSSDIPKLFAYDIVSAVSSSDENCPHIITFGLKGKYDFKWICICPSLPSIKENCEWTYYANEKDAISALKSDCTFKINDINCKINNLRKSTAELESLKQMLTDTKENPYSTKK